MEDVQGAAEAQDPAPEDPLRAQEEGRGVAEPLHEVLLVWMTELRGETPHEDARVPTRAPTRCPMAGKSPVSQANTFTKLRIIRLGVVEEAVDSSSPRGWSS